jgi:GNAT superfamily N-acetyltransferase
MYGVDSSVHPDYRGFGVGSKLMDARFAVLKSLNLRGMIAGSLFIDYHRVADTVTPAQYIQDVIDGVRTDTNLSKQIHKGFRVLNVIEEYCTEPRTGNRAAAILWENPDYDASTPIGVIAHAPRRYDVTLRPNAARA